MTTITTRSGKGSPLTNNEVDANFTNLNSDKVEASGDSMTGNLSFGDNNKAIFGAGSDLQIYHNGTTSVIEDSGTGNLQLRTSTLAVVNAAGTEVILQGVEDGAVSLYHNAGAKLATTSTGIDVTGTVTADGLTVDSTLATINSSGPNVDLVLTEGSTNTDARIRNSNGILEIDADLNNEFGNSSMVFAVDGTDKLKINNNGDISFYEDTGTTAKFFWDASAEALGIGTSSPARPLTVNGLAGFRNSTTGFTANDGFDIGVGGSDAYIVQREAANIIVETNGSERMRIDASGNVGIGSSSVRAKLDIVSSTSATPTDFNASSIFIEETGNNKYAGLTFVGGNNLGNTGTVAKLLVQNTNTAGGFEGAMMFSTRNSSSSMVERMRIDANGNVGIGTDSPRNDANFATLQIGDSSTAASQLVLDDNDSGGPWRIISNLSLIINDDTAERMRIDASGNVGINVTPESWLSSYKALQIGDAGALVGSSDDSFVAVGANAYLDSVSSNYEYINSDFATQYYQVDGTHVWRNAASGTADATISWSEAMRLDASGNLLVGTTDNTLYNNSGSGTGINLQNFGNIAVARDGNDCMVLNRLNSDGAILNIAKDGTTVGSIAYQSHGFQVNGETDHTGISFDAFAHVPLRNATRADNTVSLGTSTYRFKDLYLSGVAYANNFVGVSDTDTGIDINGTNVMKFNTGGSERARLDASGNLLVGKTAANFTVAGHEIKPGGFAGFTRDGGAPIVATRLTSDGAIQEFYKDGTTVGSIGTSSSSLYIGKASGSGLMFQGGNTIPVTGSSAADATYDLGASGVRFKDLYLSGDVNLGSTGAKITTAVSGDLITGQADTGLRFYDAGDAIIPRSTSDGQRVGTTDLGASNATFKDLYLSGYTRYGTNIYVGKGSAITGALSANDFAISTEASGSKIVFRPEGTEAMRLDASGNLLVGTTTYNSDNQGILLGATGVLYSTSTSGIAASLNRKTTDGEILRFQKDTTTVGSIGTESGYLAVGSPHGQSGYLGFRSNMVYPSTSTGGNRDDSIDLGGSSQRFDDIYATNGTIVTSDRNEKQDIETLSEAEQRVAVACKGLLRKFRWKSSVTENGDDARIHFGIIAQDLQAAFEAEGLDAGRYAMFINSTWTDEETGEERSRMGVRYSELLAFIIAAI